MNKKTLPLVGASTIGCLLAAAIASGPAVADPFSIAETNVEGQPIILAASTNVPKMKLTYSKLRERNRARRRRAEMAALEIREQSKTQKKGTEKGLPGGQPETGNGTKGITTP